MRIEGEAGVHQFSRDLNIARTLNEQLAFEQLATVFNAFYIIVDGDKMNLSVSPVTINIDSIITGAVI